MKLAKLTVTYLALLFLFTACKQHDLSSISAAADKFVNNVIPKSNISHQKSESVPLEIGQAIDASIATINMNGSFKEIVSSAVKNDPVVLIANSKFDAIYANVDITKSLREFQFFGTLYGGIEDVTDETAGLAAVLNANKLLYDGGQLESRISADEYYAAGASADYALAVDESALVALRSWVELERFRSLSDLIDSRLSVLDPLINQLERVAKAGLGDATMVSSAQRTVSMIEVTQTDVQQRLAQAEVDFLNVYGGLPASADFDGVAISKALPNGVDNKLIMNAPAVRGSYSKYRAAISNLESVRATDSVNIGFETKIQRPFGESEYNSDESIGLVFRKTLFNGGKLNSEIEAAEAQAKAQLESFKSIVSWAEGGQHCTKNHNCNEQGN